MRTLSKQVLALTFGLSVFSLPSFAADYAATPISPGQFNYENVTPDLAFTDWVSFTIGDSSSLFATVSGTSQLSFSISKFELYDATKTFVAAGSVTNFFNTASLGFVDSSFSSGTYYLYIEGNTVGGTYNGNISAVPVPEPDSYAMMLAGLGLLGFAARRRS